MPLTNRIEGIAIYCDLNGQIKSILRDDIGFSNLNPVGRLFPNVLANQSNTNFLDFMLEVKEKNIAFDYRFDLELNERSYNLYFFGILIAEKILVIGADNHKEAMEFADHLQQVNNEQSNLIRSLYKEKYSRQNEDKDTQQLFEEVSKLNNELINVQRELFKKNIELEKLNQLKNHFLGMAAHDLRNPLTIITNYAEFILEDNADKLSEQTNTFLLKIHNSAYFMLELIEDILDVSKIEAGKLQLDPQTVEFVQFSKDIIERNNIIASKKEN
jgi:signal transduction histidine kinase